MNINMKSSFYLLMFDSININSGYFVFYIVGFFIYIILYNFFICINFLDFQIEDIIIFIVQVLEVNNLRKIFIRDKIFVLFGLFLNFMIYSFVCCF